MPDQRGIIRDAKWVGRIGKTVALLLMPAAILLGAEGCQEKTVETNRNPRISISNLTGHVVVRGWDKSQVHAVYTVFSPRVEVDTEVLPSSGPADKIHFTTHLLDRMLTGKEQAADYTLDVPVESSLEIRNPQGRIRIENLQADASADSVGSSIAVTDTSGNLTVRSVGGNIEIIRPSGRVEAYSITGDLHFVSPSTQKLRASTTSGHILYEGDFMAGGDYLLSDYSGDMDVLCPPSSSFELRAKTVRGKLENRLDLTPQRRYSSPLSTSNSLLGTHNTGKATVELTSFSGAIRIRPQ